MAPKSKDLAELLRRRAEIDDEILAEAPHLVSSLSTAEHHSSREKAAKAAAGSKFGQDKSREVKARRQLELLDEVDRLRASNPGMYDSDRAAATYLIDSYPDDDRWDYFVDEFDPETRKKAIDNLRKRIGRAKKTHS